MPGSPFFLFFLLLSLPDGNDEDLIGKWNMLSVTIYNEDAAEVINPEGDRWIAFAADGSFTSGSGAEQTNAGTYTVKREKHQLHLDSDAGPGDDSDWSYRFRGDTLVMRGIGTERQQSSKVLFTRAGRKAAVPHPVPPPPPPPPPAMENLYEASSLGQIPLFPGCYEGNYPERKKCADKKLMEFIYGNLKLPASARRGHTFREGTVIASFIVEKDGKVTNAKIIQDIGEGYGAEVLRVINLMPERGIRFDPLSARGRPVRVTFRLPVVFKGE